LYQPMVAIVGRPNVGKSTLFNRLVGRRTSIVEPTAGVTRDRIESDVEWCGRRLTLVDTGGLGLEDEDGLGAQVMEQARAAAEAADVVAFLVDAREGVTALDREVSDLLRPLGERVVLVVNKADTGQLEDRAVEFYELGLGDPFPVSAEQGRNLGDLLDLVTSMLPPEARGREGIAGAEGEAVKVAIAGRPNVGKSSLLNALVGAERVIVSEIPSTTRDAVDVAWEGDPGRFVFVDTAGLRRPTRVRRGVERYGVLRALRAIARSDVVALVLDAEKGPVSQDRRIARYSLDAGKGMVFVLNKFDLVEDGPVAREEYVEGVRLWFRFVSHAPIHVTSAVTGLGVAELPEVLMRVAEERRRRVPTPALNDVLQDALALQPPSAARGRRPRIYYATQVDVAPPAFLLFVNDPSLFGSDYVRYLETRLRESFGLQGIPIRLHLRGRRQKDRRRTSTK